MLKGSILIAVFVMFIGAVLLSLILVYLLLNVGSIMVKGHFFYDAKTNVELLSGLISASSSFPGKITILYRLPRIPCELKVEDGEVYFWIKGGEYSIDGKRIRILGDQEARARFVEKLEVEDFSDEFEGGFLEIVKEGNSIRFRKVEAIE